MCESCSRLEKRSLGEVDLVSQRRAHTIKRGARPSAHANHTGWSRHIIRPGTRIDSSSVDSIKSSVSFWLPPFRNSCWLKAVK